MSNQRLGGIHALLIASFLLTQGPVMAQSADAVAAVKSLVSGKRYKQIVADMDANHQRVVDENILLQQVPAPSFSEGEKAKLFAKLLRESDSSLEVSIDEAGNVLALRRGTDSSGDVQAIIAHMDTVFGVETSLEIKREGTRLIAPGILDNCRGLASILAIVRGMKAANAITKSSILFVGSVGEEGLGDLKGVKHLFGTGAYKGRIKLAIAVDSGFPEQIVNVAAGSKRYEVKYRGPGGHSFRAFGTVSPAFALAEAASLLSKFKTPAGTTYSIGVIGGGTSVNVIPSDAWMQVDMRSSSNADLKRLEDDFVAAMKAAAATENSVRKGRMEVDIKLIGDRPSGRTESSSRLVQVALAASVSQGWQPKEYAASTDANIPMSMGIPSITVASGVGNFNHSPREYLDIEKSQSLRALQVTLISVLDSAVLTNNND